MFCQSSGSWECYRSLEAEEVGDAGKVRPLGKLGNLGRLANMWRLGKPGKMRESHGIRGSRGNWETGDADVFLETAQVEETGMFGEIWEV